MAEVSIAREGRVESLNGVRAGSLSRRPAVLMNDGTGRNVSLTPSSDKERNAALRFMSDNVSVRGASANASVDDFIRENNGSYEVKVWNTTGRGFGSGQSFGSIVPLRNNTGRVLTFRKQRGRWTGTLTERGNYGMPDRVTKVF